MSNTLEIFGARTVELIHLKTQTTGMIGNGGAAAIFAGATVQARRVRLWPTVKQRVILTFDHLRTLALQFKK